MLCTIFSLVTSHIEVDNNAIRDAGKLAAVCQRWRYAAVSDASLWSRIDLGQLLEAKRPTAAVEATSEYLARSQQFPLNIQWGNMRSPIYRVPSTLGDLLCSQSYRIANISFRTTHNSFTKFAERRISMPTLESVKILYHIHFDMDGDEGHSTLPQLFHGDLPALQHVHVDHYTSFPKDLFVNLTTLTLANQDDISTILLSHFLDVLDRSPRLKCLTINGHGPSQRDDTPSSRRTNLHHLDLLEMSFCHSPIILSHLDIPSSDIHIDNYAEFSAVDITNPLEAIPTQSHIEVLQHPETCRLSADRETMTIELTGPKPTCRVVTIRDDIDVVSDLAGSEEFALENILLSITEKIIFKSLTSVHLDWNTGEDFIQPYIERHLWVQFFRHLCGLRELSVLHIDPDELFDAFHSDSSLTSQLSFLRWSPSSFSSVDEQADWLNALTRAICHMRCDRDESSPQFSLRVGLYYYDGDVSARLPAELQNHITMWGTIGKVRDIVVENLNDRVLACS